MLVQVRPDGVSGINSSNNKIKTNIFFHVPHDKDRRSNSHCPCITQLGTKGGDKIYSGKSDYIVQ